MHTDSPARLTPQRYRDGLRHDASRFVEVLSGVEEGTVVPTCPGWSARHLAEHLAGVQHAWARIVREGVVDEDAARELRAHDALPEVASLEEALARCRETTAELLDALGDRAPEDPAWTGSTERTVGSVLRAQAHEACVHRLDAELTAAPDGGSRTLVDPLLAADGVDDLLHLRATATPQVSPTARTDRTVRVVASDTGTTWLVTVAPEEVGLDVAEADPADGTVRPRAILTGTAEDVLCAFWGRPPVTDLHRVGDLTLLTDLDRVLAHRPAR